MRLLSENQSGDNTTDSTRYDMLGRVVKTTTKGFAPAAPFRTTSYTTVWAERPERANLISPSPIFILFTNTTTCTGLSILPTHQFALTRFFSLSAPVASYCALDWNAFPKLYENTKPTDLESGLFTHVASVRYRLLIVPL